MTAVEVVLILIGVVFLLGSFFVTERLTPTEISRVAELSEDELRIVMEREMGVASAKISDIVDNTVDLSIDKVQRSMEKVSNEKIMAISEYSDSVMEKLKKINNEVTFLYSMLGDKHNELNECMAQLNELLLECQALKEDALQKQAEAKLAQRQYQTMQNSRPSLQETRFVQEGSVGVNVSPQPETAPQEQQDLEEAFNEAIQMETTAAATMKQAVQEMESAPAERSKDSIRDEVLGRFAAGEDIRNIAREMGLGFGEVKLIVELYKGEVSL